MPATSEREILADAEMANAQGLGFLSIPNDTGDTRIMWDPRSKDEVDTAKAAFDAAKAKGMVAYKVDTDSGEATREVVTRFDKKLGKIIMMTQLRGG